MSLYGALFTGVAGLNSNSTAMGAISDNIANVNTVGYKGTRIRFSTFVTEQASRTRYVPGGVEARPYTQVSRAGLINPSSSKTDLAINGGGFFTVCDSPLGTSDPSTRTYFTRAGQFYVDDQGYLRNTAGYYLMGWRTDASGNAVDKNNPAVSLGTPPNQTILTELDVVRVNNVSGQATMTSTIEFGANLPSGAATGFTQNTSVEIYDSLGSPRNMTLTWTKQAAANTWALSAAVSNPAGTTVTGLPTTVAFNVNGTLATIGGVATGDIAVTVDYPAGAGLTDPQPITLTLGTPGQATGITQRASGYNLAYIDQNGTPAGFFTNVTINEEGMVSAQFDNSTQLDLYRLPIATFRNADGLAAEAGNAYRLSEESGAFTLYYPGEGPSGVIAPSSVENSTVDIADEFTNMIVTQRAYSASAKIVTTADEMLDELIRIKR